MRIRLAVPPAPTLAPSSAAMRSRRRLLLLSPLLVLLPGAACAAPGAMATPRQALGPFYPLQPDVRAGSDLTTVDGKGRAHGKPLTIVGRVLDSAGRPQAGVLLEIWQTNAHGRYHHPHDNSPQPLDPQFRGYGRATSGADGSYRFFTIAPVEYPGRTPHVHFRASRGTRELLVTQMYLPGAAGAGNERDGLFMAVRDPAARRALLGLPEPGAANTLRFDIVLEAGG
ncbi:MAG: protocatechuate 3,4-dioxygenase [Sulfuritalea sp.]|nr:protocatechuate 3,4-dioxygenase [Sulfuritalea sp.]